MKDKRAIEGITSNLTRTLQEQNFESINDANAFMNNLMAKTNGDIPKKHPKSAIQMAQDIMYEAWDAENPDERIRLAEEALSISKDCTDAYVLLAEEKAETYGEAATLYIEGIEAGERVLGEKIFEEDCGHFWGLLETRPYMRAQAGMAECLAECGELEEAIKIYLELLRLNHNDNQGIRHIISPLLLKTKKYDILEKILEHYKGDGFAVMAYTGALLAFSKHGSTEKSDSKLKKAIETNRHVVHYLLGNKKLPKYLPEAMSFGSEEEAQDYLENNLSVWNETAGAIDWLKSHGGLRVLSKIGRNDPCYCGSGKKYKKCCINLEQTKTSVSEQKNKTNISDNFYCDTSELDELSNSVIDLINSGNIEDAEKVCNRLLTEYPEYVDGLERTACLYQAKGDKAKTKEYLLKTVKFMQNSPNEYDEELIQNILEDANNI